MHSKEKIRNYHYHQHNMNVVSPNSQITGKYNDPEWSDEKQSKFEAGVNAVFARWTLVNLAIAHEFAGHETAEIIDELKESVLDTFFEGGLDVYQDELENMFLDCFEGDLNTQVEDGSCREVATVLYNLYRECRVGNFTSVEKLVAATKSARNAVASSKGVDNTEELSDGSDDDGEGCSNDNEARKRGEKTVVVDEDGWTTIVSTKSGGGNNTKQQQQQRPSASSSSSSSDATATDTVMMEEDTEIANNSNDDNAAMMIDDEPLQKQQQPLARGGFTYRVNNNPKKGKGKKK